MSEASLDAQLWTADAPVLGLPDRATVLVVDGDPVNRMLLAANVQAEGLLTIEASRMDLDPRTFSLDDCLPGTVIAVDTARRRARGRRPGLGKPSTNFGARRP